MDTHAYLLGQGWSGPGNPLNPNRRPGPHGGLGLTKPILVARKKNTHGLGKQTTHDHTNQWWLRGFEAALKGVGDDGSATPQSDGSGSAASGSSELYRFFVKGEPLEGTIDRVMINEGKEVKGGCEISTAPGRGEKNGKRKRSDENDADMEEREERALKREKRRKKCKPDERDSSEGGVAEDAGLAVESKEERRRRRKERKERNKEKGTAKLEEDSSDARADKKRRKKRQKLEDADPDSLSQGEREGDNEPADEDGISEKKVRKKQKKLKKEEKRARRELKRKEKKSKRRE
ncbi:uncharacterized protein BDCG_04936 [Blastomyces dermatitidis ER-3]|uniref:Protein TMA23 n=1 Tax=Ajellomyces dermatitidis (strain ER-3 / ATCC MYA-2586) TaxID=559297 RepID=A0ABP2F1W7_AJEDR|nr:uncharacterized protein BDCG_04936 [Blastomyces dermatitidis ER-3]EEQ89816.1 hypothetical protein BDCG_04936 [Blastomyces dermatitidis ER-3]